MAQAEADGTGKAKAVDIAQNPKAMAAAIKASPKVAAAAAAALPAKTVAKQHRANRRQAMAEYIAEGTEGMTADEIESSNAETNVLRKLVKETADAAKNTAAIIEKPHVLVERSADVREEAVTFEILFAKRHGELTPQELAMVLDNIDGAERANNIVRSIATGESVSDDDMEWLSQQQA
jgi:hypothetical protein